MAGFSIKYIESKNCLPLLRGRFNFIIYNTYNPSYNFFTIYITFFTM